MIITSQRFPEFHFHGDGAAVTKTNYQKLIQRRPGDKFKVDLDGSFLPLSYCERVRYFFSKSYRKDIQKKVAAAVDKIFCQIKDPHIDLNQAKSLLSKVGRLSPHVFDRLSLKKTCFYEDLKNKIVFDITKNYQEEDKLFWSLAAEVQIAAFARIDPIRNGGGTSGNYRMRNLAGRTVMLFKPVRESPHGPENPYLSIRIRNAFQNMLGFRKNPVLPEEEGHKREEFASRFCKILKWKTEGESFIPKARVASLASQAFFDKEKVKEGSLHLWIDGCENGEVRVLNNRSMVLNLNVSKTAKVITFIALAALALLVTMASVIFPLVGSVALSSISASGLIFSGTLLLRKMKEIFFGKDPDLESFKRSAVLAFLLCNLDFNLGNMLFKKNSNKFHVIDFWFSMPQKEPLTWLDTRNMHLWDRLKHAEKIIEEQDLNDIKQCQADLFQLTDNTFGAESEETALFKKRFEILQGMIGKPYSDLSRLERVVD